MGTIGLTGEAEHPFTIDPTPEEVTLAPGGEPARAGVRVTATGKPGTGQVRVVVGFDAESGLTFTNHELNNADETSYPAGADSRADTLSFDGVVIDSDSNPVLSVEILAGEDADAEPTSITFVVGAATCTVPVRIAGPDSE